MAYHDDKCFSEPVALLGTDYLAHETDQSLAYAIEEYATQWVCLCYLSDEEARDFRLTEDQLAVVRRRTALLIDYCQGKIEHRAGMPVLTQREKRIILDALPSYNVKKLRVSLTTINVSVHPLVEV